MCTIQNKDLHHLHQNPDSSIHTESWPKTSTKSHRPNHKHLTCTQKPSIQNSPCWARARWMRTNSTTRQTKLIAILPTSLPAAHHVTQPHTKTSIRSDQKTIKNWLLANTVNSPKTSELRRWPWLRMKKVHAQGKQQNGEWNKDEGIWWMLVESFGFGAYSNILTVNCQLLWKKWKRREVVFYFFPPLRKWSYWM